MTLEVCDQELQIKKKFLNLLKSIRNDRILFAYMYIYNLYVYTWIEWGICYIFLIIVFGLPAYKNVFKFFL